MFQCVVATRLALRVHIVSRVMDSVSVAGISVAVTVVSAKRVSMITLHAQVSILWY